MPIKSGIGVGEAQIYDTSNLENSFMRIVAQKQKQDAMYADELATALARVDVKNLDPKDAKYVLEKYKGLKDLNTQAASLRDDTQKRLAKAQINKGVDEINEYAANAKAWRKSITEVGVLMADPKNFSDYDDSAREEVKSLVNSAYIDAVEKGKAAITPFTYQRKPDLSLIPKDLDQTRKDLEEAAKNPKNLYTTQKDGYNITGYQLKPQEVDVVLTGKLLTNDNLKYQYKQLYKQQNPDKPEPTDLDLANFYKAQYEQKYPGNPYTFIGSPTKIAKERKEETSEDKLTYRQQLITGLINQDEDYRQELQANLPPNTKVQYGKSRAIPGVSKGGYRFVKVTIPEESSPTGVEITETIPLEAGKPVQKLNYIINQYSPEKVSPSKVGISGGAPRGEKFVPSTTATKLPTISSQEQYNKLKKGQKYLSADGIEHIKK